MIDYSFNHVLKKIAKSIVPVNPTIIWSFSLKIAIEPWITLLRYFDYAIAHQEVHFDGFLDFILFSPCFSTHF
jgi:hypothetical protein